MIRSKRSKRCPFLNTLTWRSPNYLRYIWLPFAGIVSGSRSVDTLGIAQRSPERPGRKCGSARIA